MCGFVLKFGYTPKSIVWTTNMKILASNQNLYGRWALGGPQRTPKMTFFKVFINVVFLMEINSLYIKYKIIAKKNFFFRTGRFVGGPKCPKMVNLTKTLTRSNKGAHFCSKSCKHLCNALIS